MIISRRKVHGEITAFLTILFVLLASFICSVAEVAAALTICTLLMVPQMAEAVKQAMLLIWAYREGILDVKYLLSGRRIPLAKTYDTWRLPLGGIMGSGNAVVTEAGLTDEEDGLNYEEYLRILLFLTDCGECSMRSLDMIEVGLKERKNLEFFHIDHCITRMKVKSIAELRSGITYDFSTEFFYR